LTKLGVFERTTEKRNGRERIVYDWRRNVRQYVVHLRKPREESRDDYQHEKQLTQQIVRQQKELELAIARGDMIKRARVVLVMTSLLTQIKNHMLGVPARVTRPLIMQRDPVKIRTILSTAIANCLREAVKFGDHSFDEMGKNGASKDDNDALKRAAKRVAKRRRKS
jgi:phage terminase Nu1 subunit (DNA packaging protein)